MGLLEPALFAFGELLKKFPDYDQRKKEKYYDLFQEWQTEKSKVIRDNQLIDDLADELRLFLEVFSKEISG